MYPIHPNVTPHHIFQLNQVRRLTLCLQFAPISSGCPLSSPQPNISRVNYISLAFPIFQRMCSVYLPQCRLFAPCSGLPGWPCLTPYPQHSPKFPQFPKMPPVLPQLPQCILPPQVTPVYLQLSWMYSNYPDAFSLYQHGRLAPNLHYVPVYPKCSLKYIFSGSPPPPQSSHSRQFTPIVPAFYLNILTGTFYYQWDVLGLPLCSGLTSTSSLPPVYPNVLGKCKSCQFLQKKTPFVSLLSGYPNCG